MHSTARTTSDLYKLHLEVSKQVTKELVSSHSNHSPLFQMNIICALSSIRKNNTFLQHLFHETLENSHAYFSCGLDVIVLSKSLPTLNLSIYNIILIQLKKGQNIHKIV